MNTHYAGYVPAKAIQQSPVSREFYYWLGASQQRYLHTVFPIDADFKTAGANLIIVRRNPDGTRIPLYVGRIGELTTYEVDHLKCNSGANELHIHLMATDDTAAAEIAADLLTRHMYADDREFEIFDSPIPFHPPVSSLPPTPSQPAAFFANVSF